jgi:tRNA-Thr(GGU) m(6)t(6)A37 methyltransferase TsaA
MEGLVTGQEILVIFWFHHSTHYDLRQHPQGDKTRAKRGVFSLRSPNRPNPIGITQVRIKGIDNNVLYVTNLDAFNGTPVLDLKPVSETSSPLGRTADRDYRYSTTDSSPARTWYPFGQAARVMGSAD